ncbi:MAG TPA: HepT-like ribonuclease domain-containing protein [Hyphomicrobiales bacterium]|jgi:uncharacterized protein with HEPN domain
MSKKLRPILADILAAIEGIENATAEIAYSDFEQSWVIRHAVQRGVEIISEAARRIPDEVLSQYPDIPWLNIKAIGNILRHEYHNIRDNIVWNIVETHLPPLKQTIVAMLASLPEGK